MNKLLIAFTLGLTTMLFGGLTATHASESIGGLVSSEIADDGHIHQVVEGETLWFIAMEYDVDFEALLDANHHFDNPDLIHPKDTVFLPMESSTDQEVSEEPMEDGEPSPNEEDVPVEEDNAEPVEEPTENEDHETSSIQYEE